MAASNTTITLPNPNTPMAFVPPDLELNMRNETYAAIGSLAVLLWDIIVHVAQDYRVVIQYGINFSFILYFIARVTSLAYILGVVIISTAPIGNCDRIARQISILSLAVPLSVLPFLMRVSALYRNNRYVVAFFSTMWLFVLSCYIVLPLHTFANVLTSSPILIYDTLIFFATSWAFMKNSYSDATVKNGMRVMVLGRYLPAFSKSLLRDGQAYYSATLFLNLLFSGLAYIQRSPVSACAIAFPFYVLLNNMSSHVYRNMRLGFYQDQTLGSSVINRALPGRIQPPHHEAVNPTTTILKDRGDPGAGGVTNPRTSLAQGTQGEVKQDGSPKD